MKKLFLIIVLLPFILLNTCSYLRVFILEGNIVGYNNHIHFHVSCIAEDGTPIDKAVKEFKVDSSGKYYLKIASINLYPRQITLHYNNTYLGYILFKRNENIFYAFDSNGIKYQLNKIMIMLGQDKFPAYKGVDIPIYNLTNEVN